MIEEPISVHFLVVAKARRECCKLPLNTTEEDEEEATARVAATQEVWTLQ